VRLRSRAEEGNFGEAEAGDITANENHLRWRDSPSFYTTTFRGGFFQNERNVINSVVLSQEF
jgi:hypothetical protein